VKQANKLTHIYIYYYSKILKANVTD